jgi:hypothetical protein
LTAVNLSVFNFVNNSTVFADAALYYDPPPPPPKSQLDDIVFTWYDPLGQLAFTEMIGPDDNAAARGFLFVDQTGQWSVNVSYETNSSVYNNKSFDVLPNYWGPGTVHLTHTTAVPDDGFLTIEPGTTVESDSGVALVVRGEVVADGTPANPIVFTSSQIGKSPGDWSYLALYNTSNISVIDNIDLEYSNEGLTLFDSSTNVTNSTFNDNNHSAIHAMFSTGLIKNNYIERGGSGISPIGIRSDGSHVTIEGNEIHFMRTGIYLLATNDSTIDNLIMDSEIYGLWIDNSIVYSTGDTLLGNTGGVQVDSRSEANFEDLTVTGRVEGFGIADKSNAILWNSTVEMAEITTFDLSQNCHVTLVNTTFGTVSGNPGVSIMTGDNSDLTVQNFLTVEVISHDNGSHLENATIDVYDGSTLIQQVQSDQNGLAPLLVLTDMVYMPTPINNLTKVHVSYADLAFQMNNRTVEMAQTHTEMFNGSTEDLDGDGEPDFSDLDIDGDDLSNDIENSIGTDPNNPDSDSDGIPDGYEFDYQSLDPLSAGDASLDPDDDGLTNLEEYLNGTSPDLKDTDGDGVNDLKEIGCGMNPINESDAHDDWDDDGYSNGKECNAGTDLWDPDEGPEPGIDMIMILLAVVIVVVILVLVLIMMRKRRSDTIVEESPSEEEEEEPPEEEPEEAE